MKKVSVVMCTFNGERFIRQQLDSVINQTYPIYEIIIQDDLSSDHTVEIINEYCAKCTNIRLIINAENMGCNKNIFSALAKAKGEFLAIADQDDIWELNKIEKQIHAIGDKLLCSGKSIEFSDDHLPVSHHPANPNYHLQRLLYLGSLAGHTFLFSKRLIKLMPDLNEFVNVRCYDVILTMVASAHKSIIYIDEIMVYHRRHADALTLTQPLYTGVNVIKILNRITLMILCYIRCRSFVENRFHHTRHFLEKIQVDNNDLEESKKICLYMSSRTLQNYILLTLLCIRNRDKLFHSYKGKGVVSLIMAICFPITSCEYFRTLI